VAGTGAEAGPTLEPGHRLAHYKIVRLLGRGGQANAYLAEDTRLGRPVVLKTLRGDAGGERARRRLEREACLCSVLDNPNICAIYDLGELDGVVYIAMQYVEGPTLKELLARGPLTLLSALSIAIQVSDALAVAHAAGVVHRDIKPGNVIVTAGGQAKVLDFGLARALAGPRSGRTGDDLTDAGVPYGTLGYGSPEQAAGEPADHRADVFSLGVVLYEMLAGRRPFAGQAGVDVLRAVINETPEPLALRRPDCPPELQTIVDRALAKQARHRYQTMAALRDDLKALMRRLSHETGVVPTEASATLLRPQRVRNSWLTGTAVARALGWLRQPGPARADGTPSPREPAPAPQPISEKSIAVLPFRNLAQDSSLDPLRLALADGLASALAGLTGLAVRPLDLVVRHLDSEVEVPRLAQELSVGFLLTGSFLVSGGRLRLRVQLLGSGGSDLVWADRVDAARDDVLAAQDAITEVAVAAVRQHLELAATAAPPGRNAEAHGFYLRGREMLGHFVQRTFDVEDLELAIRLLNEAVGADPAFVAAHAALARCYLLHAQGYGGTEYVRLAERSVRRALDLDPSFVRARVQAAHVSLLDGDRDGAERSCAALERELPGYPGVIELRALLLRLEGQHEAALGAYDRLLARSPADAAVIGFRRARVLLSAGEPGRARDAAERALAEAPHHALAQAIVAQTWLEVGLVAEAAALLEQVLLRHRDLDGLRPPLACCLALLGEAERARALLGARVQEVASADPDTALWLACAWARLGDQEAALSWLEKAWRLGLRDRGGLARSSHLAGLRGEARYQALAGS
jgi:serine/threonine-protein kinase